MPSPFYYDWRFTQRLLFRFFCCFFIIYIFPFPVNALDFFSYGSDIRSSSNKLLVWYFAILDGYTNMWHKFIPWFAAHILRLKTPITIFTNGSGDTTYDYVQLLSFFIIALLATLVWSVIDRKRKSYHDAYHWLRVFVRYFLGSTLMLYGFDKIFHLQMPFPSLNTLTQPLGDQSPMGLAWNFVGYSKAFSAFTGWGETIAGLLLFFRRTTTLGALLSVVVMANVVAINFCYDIPVKLFSSVLWIMSAFLLAPDLDALRNLLVLRRDAQPADSSFSLNKKWKRITRFGLKWIFIAFVLYGNISWGLKMQKQYGDLVPKPYLYGIYNTVTVIRNKDTVQPLTSDTTRWKQLIIPYEKFGKIRLMNDSASWYNFVVDSVKKTITVFSEKDTLNKSRFQFKKDSVWLVLTGKIQQDSVYMRLKRFDPNSFRLVSRGFHWINEYPYSP